MFCTFLRFVVASIYVSENAHHWVVGEDAGEAFGGCVGAVGDDDLAAVLGVTDADAAAVVEADPGCAAGGVDEGVQERPI